MPNTDGEPHAPGVADPFFWPGVLLAFAITSITVGLIWDISWHTTIGRDTFWTPAHMAIYLGGAMGGFVGGWLALKYTFLVDSAEKSPSVKIFGARAPLGAWVAIWGAIAMLTSGPFDDWWHNAYGLDVKIISPPHSILGLGMFGISAGSLLLLLSRQNQRPGDSGAGLFIYVGGIFPGSGGRLYFPGHFSQSSAHRLVCSRLCLDDSDAAGGDEPCGQMLLACHPRGYCLHSVGVPDDLDTASFPRPTQARPDF